MDALIPYLKFCGLDLASFGPDIDRVPTTDPNFVDFIGDGMIAFARQSIDTGSDKEIGADFPCGAKELVDVILTIADVNAAAICRVGDALSWPVKSRLMQRFGRHGIAAEWLARRAVDHEL